MPWAVPQKLTPLHELPRCASSSSSSSSFLPTRKNLNLKILRRLQVTCKSRYSPGDSYDGPSSSSSSSFSYAAIQNLALMIQSCSDERELKRVHSLAAKLFGNSLSFLNNNLISGYLRFYKIDDARKVFNSMIYKNIVSWTAILNGYQEMGMELDFSLLLMQMLESGVQPNSQTCVCILNFCSKFLDFDLGKGIHASIIKGEMQNLILDSALLYFYVNCSDLESALNLFDRMLERDVVSFTTMISGFVQAGEGSKAFSMFSNMHHLSLLPNEFTVAAILKCCGEERELGLGRQLHAAILKKVFKEDVFVGSSLVFMYGKCGEISDARKLFDDMPSRNTVTWTSMISGYTQNGLPGVAISLFRKMKSRRIVTNDQTIIAVLGALGLERAFLLGKEIHGMVMKRSNHSSIDVCGSLIWFYCQCGAYEYAEKVLEDMPEKDVIPWTALITGYTNSGFPSDALTFMTRMVLSGIEPNPFTYSSALKACARMEDKNQGREIHAAVNKTSSLLNLFVGNSLMSLYMKCGCPEDAVKIFELMPERNFVSWKVMIIGYAKNGLCDEAFKLVYRMQAEGFDADDYIYSTVLTSCGDLTRGLRHETSCLCSK